MGNNRTNSDLLLEASDQLDIIQEQLIFLRDVVITEGNQQCVEGGTGGAKGGHATTLMDIFDKCGRVNKLLDGVDRQTPAPPKCGMYDHKPCGVEELTRDGRAYEARYNHAPITDKEMTEVAKDHIAWQKDHIGLQKH